MSGLYIPCMEMPKGLGKTITIYPNGAVRVWVNNKGSGELLEQRAVPVPDHGRLIDADEFFTSLSMDDKTTIVEAMHISELLANAPTIIPARGGNENVDS